MKTTSLDTDISKAGEKLKSSDCYKNVDVPGSVGITLVEDIPLPGDPKAKAKNDDKDSDSPAQILAWLSNVHQHFAPKFGSVDIKELEEMLSLYLRKVSSCISKCYVPNRAAKMKRCIGDILHFFNLHYREIPEIKKTYSTYLDKLTELMAYYIDMEIQASSRAKEAPQAIASKLTISLFTFLDKSHDHILDSILKANNMNRNFWELCSLLFSGVLRDTPNRILSDLTYVRYILVYKMWKRVVQGPEERKKVMSLASLRLKHPPQFVEKIRAGFLNGIVPRIPKKKADVTTFLIQAKFDVKEKAKVIVLMNEPENLIENRVHLSIEAFLKYAAESKTNVMFAPAVPAIKTDIPLLVGHLPDFGPSPNLVKLEPPEIEDEDPQNVDISGSRLMNEVWTSINHEASFREAIRMQNVTTFNKAEAKLAERKKMHRVLKQRKGRVKNSFSKTSPAPPKETGHQVEFDKSYDQQCTIVVSDDDEKDSEPTDELRGSQRKKSKKRTQDKGGDTNSKFSEKNKEKDLPVSESPTSPSPLTVQNLRILTPSQIKREIQDDLVEDVAVDLPLPQKCVEDGIIGKEAPEGRKDNIPTCPKSEVECEETIVGSPEKTIEPMNEMCDLKEERLSPPKENEVAIITNISDRIKSPGGIHRESEASDLGVKLPEIPEENENRTSGADARVAKSASSPEKKRKEDVLLFDDEDSSWSPSGGSQEFIQRVVTNFISEYSPDDEVDNRIETASGGIVSGSQVVDDDIDLAGLAYGEKSAFADADAPPPKRCRMEEAHLEEGSSVPINNQSTSVVDPVVAAQPTESNQNEGIVLEPASNLGKHPLHAETLRFHHCCYMEQAKFRDLCTSFLVKPEDEVPSAYFKDPTTGRLTQGCSCEQCTANFKALCSNVKCLVDFKTQTLLSMENDPGTSVSADALDPFEGKQDESMEGMGDFSGGSGEPSVQLPFKKRKAFSGRDDGESQHSDASKEEVEPRPWPEEFPSHTPTRMFSIAALEDIAVTRTQPLGSCMYEALPSCASTSANPGGFFATDYHPNPPTGGGFPPFASVVPPKTYSASQDSDYSSQASDFGRRHFRTPAELKASFLNEPASVSESPWTQDLVNVAYFTRKLNSTSLAYPSNSKKTSKSRKSKYSNKTKKKL